MVNSRLSRLLIILFILILLIVAFINPSIGQSGVSYWSVLFIESDVNKKLK